MIEAEESGPMPKQSIRQTIAKRIKKLRAAKSMTQTDLAKRAGINRSYLADIEMGNRNFGIDTLEKILKGLDTSYSEFFKGR